MTSYRPDDLLSYMENTMSGRKEKMIDYLCKASWVADRGIDAVIKWYHSTPPLERWLNERRRRTRKD